MQSSLAWVDQNYAGKRADHVASKYGVAREIIEVREPERGLVAWSPFSRKAWAKEPLTQTQWRSGRERNSHGFLRARGSKSGDSLSVSPELAPP